MNKEQFKEFRKTLNIEEITNYYIEHGEKETVLHYGISYGNWRVLQKEYSIHIPRELQTQRQTKTMRMKVQENYQSIYHRISKEDVFNYFEIENHSLEDCAKHFNLPLVTFIKLCRYYNIKKSQEAKTALILKTKTEKYGNPTYNNREKCKVTCLEKYGVDNPFKDVEKMRKALEGIPRNPKGCKDTTPNVEFATLLDNAGIQYTREFGLSKYSYDFKIGNTLVGINPTATHNSTWSPFIEHGLDKFYHRNKSQTAQLSGYHCINVWDWDNIEKVVMLLSPKEKIYARKCIVKEVSKEDCDKFLNDFHFQGTCTNQTIRLGLYFKDKLVQLMTFGRPRYSKKAEFELLRLCTIPTNFIIGGSEKLFTTFLNRYNPNSIVSYCDKSKFVGEVYDKLGFISQGVSGVSKHWVNTKTNKHITDNLLRQRGFDQLFHTNYGKGTSNTQLMLENGFVEVFDCGQETFLYNNK